MEALLPIAVDLGQGACRVATRSDAGDEVRSQAPGYWAMSDPFEHLAQVILAAVGVRTDLPVRIGIGMTGVDDGAPGLGSLGDRLVAGGIRGELVLCSDRVTAYLGALGAVSGAVVAAGTGAVALGVNLGDGAARSDGWGSFLGDRGSGYWIGRRAVRAAFHCRDRALPSDLVGIVADRWGSLADLPGRWRDEPPTPDDVAAIAPQVAEAARGGDLIARDIWERAGRLLGGSVTDVIVAAGLTQESVPFAGTGALFAAADLLTTAFVDAVQSDCPHATVVTSAGDPLAGAIALASGLELPDVFRSLVASLPLTGKN